MKDKYTITRSNDGTIVTNLFNKVVGTIDSDENLYFDKNNSSFIIRDEVIQFLASENIKYHYNYPQ